MQTDLCREFSICSAANKKGDAVRWITFLKFYEQCTVPVNKDFILKTEVWKF